MYFVFSFFGDQSREAVAPQELSWFRGAGTSQLRGISNQAPGRDFESDDNPDNWKYRYGLFLLWDGSHRGIRSTKQRKQHQPQLQETHRELYPGGFPASPIYTADD